MNGNVADKFLSSIDPDDPDYQRQLMRPAEIKEDVKLMEQRKRVSLILKSEAFREELEQIIESQLGSGPQSVSLLALQQIADALQLPRSTSSAGGTLTNGTGTLNGQSGHSGTLRASSGAAAVANAPLPINDIRGVDSLNYSRGEKLLRCKLASACRLLDVLGWASSGASLSARVTADQDGQAAFLVTPFGLLPHEVTASALLKVDAQGTVLDGGSTLFGLANRAWQLDAALYAARPSLRCVVHVRTPAAVAISAARAGLQALSLEAVACGRAAVISASGAAVAREAGDANVLLVRNVGLVCCADSVEAAFYYVQQAVQACEAQLAAAALGIDQLCFLDDAHRDTLRATIDAQLAALPKAALPLSADSPAASPMNVSLAANASEGLSPATAKWQLGEVEFEALMRYLDNSGFRTGYPYRIAVVKHGQKAREHHTDLEIPPTASSLADELQQFDLAHGDGHASQLLKEISAAKKSATLPIPKQSAASDREVKKEIKEQHARVRDQYYRDAVSSGPQSRVLDGITYNEAQKLREEAEAQGQRGPSVTAASKAIIQREKQSDAVIYRGHTERNPFDKVTDAELHDYVDEVSGRKPPAVSSPPEPAPAPVVVPQQQPSQPQPQPQQPVKPPAEPPKQSPASPIAPAPVVAAPQPQPQVQPASPEKQQVAMRQPPAPAPAPVPAAAPPPAQAQARPDSTRTQTLPYANNADPSLRISTPVGTLNATASLQRPPRVDRSKSERVPSGSVKAQVAVEAQAAPRIVTADNASADEESTSDTPAKKDKKKKEKSGIFASFSKKKEKSK